MIHIIFLYMIFDDKLCKILILIKFYITSLYNNYIIRLVGVSKKVEKGNNNKVIIALLIVVIGILSVLCILFATDTISFKSNNVDNNELSNENIEYIKYFSIPY